MSVLHFRNRCKHLKSEAKLEELMDTLEEDDGDTINPTKRHKKDSDREKNRENEYKQFLQQLESDLGNFEEDDEDYIEDDEE